MLKRKAARIPRPTKYWHVQAEVGTFRSHEYVDQGSNSLVLLFSNDAAQSVEENSAHPAIYHTLLLEINIVLMLLKNC